MSLNIQKAKAAGYTDDEINQYLATQKPVQQPQPQKEGFHATDLLPLVGAVGGSFIPGLGTIAGGAAGAGLGTILKELFQNKPLNAGEIGKEALLSGAGGAASKGLGFIGSKLLPGLGPKLATTGEDLAVKAFRPNPGQLTHFSDTTGEDFGKFLSSRGITSPQQIANKIDALQEPFDKVVMNSNLHIDPTNILQKFGNEITRLNKSLLPENQSTAKTLQDIALNFIDHYGAGPVPAPLLTTLRREVDQGIKDFSLDPRVKGPLNLTRDIFQNSLRDAADNAGLKVQDKSLKDAGVELSKLYKVLEISDRQQNLGRGNLPAGITRLLGASVGGAAGGVPGAAAGMAATSAINNPETMSTLSRILSTMGQGASKIPALSEQGATNLTRTGVATGAGAGMGDNQDMTGNDIIPQPGQSQNSLTMSSNEPQTNPKEQQLKQILGQIMFSKAKTTSDIKTAYDFLNPSSAAKPLTDAQKKTHANAESGIRALDNAEALLKEDSLAPLKSKIPIVKGQSPYTAASREIMDVLTRLRTGAALNQDEQKFYEQQLPQPFDSQKTIAYKLSIFRNLFETLADQGGGNAGNQSSNDMFSLFQ